jgi:hypothetical protein
LLSVKSRRWLLRACRNHSHRTCSPFLSLKSVTTQLDTKEQRSGSKWQTCLPARFAEASRQGRKGTKFKKTIHKRFCRFPLSLCFLYLSSFDLLTYFYQYFIVLRRFCRKRNTPGSFFLTGLTRYRRFPFLTGLTIFFINVF